MRYPLHLVGKCYDGSLSWWGWHVASYWADLGLPGAAGAFVGAGAGPGPACGGPGVGIFSPSSKGVLHPGQFSGVGIPGITGIILPHEGHFLGPDTSAGLKHMVFPLSLRLSLMTPVYWRQAWRGMAKALKSAGVFCHFSSSQMFQKKRRDLVSASIFKSEGRG